MNDVRQEAFVLLHSSCEPHLTFGHSAAVVRPSVNRVSGRALLDLQTSTDPASQAEQQQAASLSTILEWETELPVSSPPVGAQSAVAPSLQLLAADAPAAPAAEAHALPATAGPKLRGLPSPSLLAEVAAFPASSPPDNTNSSGAAGDAAAAAAAEHDTAPGATAIMVVERASVRTRCRNSSRCREASQAPTNSSRGDAAAGQPHRIDVATNTATQVADLSVPDRCIIAGSALFSSCAAEFNAAQVRTHQQSGWVCAGCFPLLWYSQCCRQPIACRLLARFCRCATQPQRLWQPGQRGTA